MYDRPEVGKTVTVTTDWSDVMATSMPNVRAICSTNTQTGQVVKNDDLDDPTSFNIMTGILHFPVANIPLHRVTSLEYVDGTKAATLKEVAKEDVETFIALGSKGDEYVVTRNGERWSCECIGNSQFGKLCRHIKEKKQEVIDRSK